MTRYVGYTYFNELKQPCCGPYRCALCNVQLYNVRIFAFVLRCVLHALHLIGFIAYAHLTRGVVFIEVEGLF